MTRLSREPKETDILWGMPDGYAEHHVNGHMLVRSEGFTYVFRPGENADEWIVQGVGGEYRCHASEVWCRCKHHAMRLVDGERCKHLRALDIGLQSRGSTGDEADEEEIETLTDEELRKIFA